MITDAVTAVFSTVKGVLDKFIPDAKDRLEAELLITKQLQALDLAQIEVNKVEAAHANIFVSGWRPFIGWVCAATLAYSVIGNDAANWTLQLVAQYTGKAVPVLPEPDVTLTFELLMGMLGLGGMRTFEKMKGIATK